MPTFKTFFHFMHMNLIISVYKAVYNITVYKVRNVSQLEKMMCLNKIRLQINQKNMLYFQYSLVVITFKFIAEKIVYIAFTKKLRKTSSTNFY